MTKLFSGKIDKFKEPPPWLESWHHCSFARVFPMEESNIFSR